MRACVRRPRARPVNLRELSVININFDHDADEQLLSAKIGLSINHVRPRRPAKRVRHATEISIIVFYFLKPNEFRMLNVRFILRIVYSFKINFFFSTSHTSRGSLYTFRTSFGHGHTHTHTSNTV